MDRALGKGSKPRFFRRHPRTATVILVIAFLVIADLSLGALYRLFTGDSFYYSVIDPARGLNRRYRTQSPLYHHDLRKNVSMPASWAGGYRVFTNSLGFKDREVREVPLEPSGARAVFIGDSFTEGVGMDYEDTFVGLLDARFAPQGVEVLNAGVSSYSPAIYYRKIRYLLEDVGLRFTDLVVFIDISDAQDEALHYTLDEDDRVLGHGDDGWLKRFLKEYSILYGAPRAIRLSGAASANEATGPALQPNRSITNPRGLWTVDPALRQQYGDRGVARMIENMDRLLAVIRPRGIELTIVVYPWPAQIHHRDLDSVQVRIWREWARENDVRFINLFPDFVSGDDATNTGTIASYFIQDDFHWNAAGHRRIAELFIMHGGLSDAGTRQPHPPAPSR